MARDSLVGSVNVEPGTEDSSPLPKNFDIKGNLSPWIFSRLSVLEIFYQHGISSVVS
jgi:hypothetical protein